MLRYREFIDFLGRNDISCWSFDQRGFGSSEGRRGHIDNFEEYVDDLIVLISSIEKGDTPFFVLGHSMGALVTLLYAARRPAELAGIICLSTPLMMPNKLMRWSLPVVASIVSPLPAFSISNFIQASKLSHDPEVVQNYLEDDLNTRTITTHWLAAFNNARRKSLDNLSRIDLPIFVGHGTEDEVASLLCTKHFRRKINAAKLSVNVYEGLRHELLNENEPGRSRVQRDIVDWLLSNIHRETRKCPD
jgi:acylglycerol lipase